MTCSNKRIIKPNFAWHVSNSFLKDQTFHDMFKQKNNKTQFCMTCSQYFFKEKFIFLKDQTFHDMFKQKNHKTQFLMTCFQFLITCFYFWRHVHVFEDIWLTILFIIVWWGASSRCGRANYQEFCLCTFGRKPNRLVFCQIFVFQGMYGFFSRSVD